MTLIKSILLGSAAGLVAVASAQAADLPTRKGPVAAEYVRICSITVAGAPVVGFVLPGSDTCIKISGYITAQMEGGNLSQGYGMDTTTTRTMKNAAGNTVANPYFGRQFFVASGNGGTGAGTPNVYRGTGLRDSIGYATRYNLTLDTVTNTAYGPLVGHGEYQFNAGQGYDTLWGGSDGGLNEAYLTWAGLTAGKAPSFFSFTGGGYGYANFFSPDRKGYAQPELIAYTASFGGGFAATISVENPYAPIIGYAGGVPIAVDPGTYQGYLGSANEEGMRVPDLVAALSVHQAWGMAQVSGVAHNIRAASTSDNATLDKWGFAIDAGVQFNIPSIAGATVGLTGAWSQNAVWYSGIPDAMWGENGAVGGNGQAMAIGDAFYNGNGTWATPDAWSISGYTQFVVNPQITLQLEGSYGEVNWSGQGADSPLFDSKSFIVGGVGHWDPVKNLDFALELMYQDTQSTQPGNYRHAVAGTPMATANWQGQGQGFETRLMITRSF